MPTSTFTPPKRFIAGAVCPRCGAMDRIVVHGDGDHRECIDCGFSDARPGTPSEEPLTRVTRASARRVETQAQPVKLLDPRLNADKTRM